MEDGGTSGARPQLCPRPALGLRPWFAFLRRASILRRFAFAMIGKGTRRRGGSIRSVVLCCSDWDSGPLTAAGTRRERRRGLTPAPGPFGLLLRARSIHGYGMASDLHWVGLGSGGVVVAVGTLRPRRVLVAPHPVRWVAEVPVSVPPPRVGDRLRAVPILVSWPDD